MTPVYLSICLSMWAAISINILKMLWNWYVLPSFTTTCFPLKMVCLKFVVYIQKDTKKSSAVTSFMGKTRLRLWWVPGAKIVWRAFFCLIEKVFLRITINSLRFNTVYHSNSIFWRCGQCPRVLVTNLLLSIISH